MAESGGAGHMLDDSVETYSHKLHFTSLSHGRISSSPNRPLSGRPRYNVTEQNSFPSRWDPEILGVERGRPFGQQSQICSTTPRVLRQILLFCFARLPGQCLLRPTRLW
jgi:hypothetical protein